MNVESVDVATESVRRSAVTLSVHFSLSPRVGSEMCIRDSICLAFSVSSCTTANLLNKNEKYLAI